MSTFGEASAPELAGGPREAQRLFSSQWPQGVVVSLARTMTLQANASIGLVFGEGVPKNLVFRLPYVQRRLPLSSHAV